MLLICTSIALWPAVLASQEVADTIDRTANCALAARVLSGESSEKKPSWAWSRLVYCDSNQRASVQRLALHRARSSTDRDFVGPAIGRVAAEWDMALFDEVLAIAGDRSATVPARVYAFVTLASMRDPHASPSYEGFVGGLDDKGLPRGLCSLRRTHAREDRVLTPSLQARMDELVRRVRRDSSEPSDVQSAAACT
jgi:hypothetical protein